MKRILYILIIIGVSSYFALYFYIYSIQDDRFKSSTLPQNHQFQIETEFEELTLTSINDGRLNSLLLKSDSSQGVVYFLKGNGGTLENWASIAPIFLFNNYDVLITDYRQHGKSTGEITQDNFYSDTQAIYNFLKTRYSESRITVIGYSLGAALASHLSATNNPNQTILIDPKTNFSVDIFDKLFFVFPSVNRFRFNTLQDVQTDNTPISIIIGSKSGLYNDAKKLKRLLKKDDNFFEIEGVNHQTILGHLEFKKILANRLKSR